MNYKFPTEPEWKRHQKKCVASSRSTKFTRLKLVPGHGHICMQVRRHGEMSQRRFIKWLREDTHKKSV